MVHTLLKTAAISSGYSGAWCRDLLSGPPKRFNPGKMSYYMSALFPDMNVYTALGFLNYTVLQDPSKDQKFHS